MITFPIGNPYKFYPRDLELGFSVFYTVDNVSVKDYSNRVTSSNKATNLVANGDTSVIQIISDILPTDPNRAVSARILALDGSFINNLPAQFQVTNPPYLQNNTGVVLSVYSFSFSGFIQEEDFIVEVQELANGEPVSSFISDPFKRVPNDDKNSILISYSSFDDNDIVSGLFFLGGSIRFSMRYMTEMLKHESSLTKNENLLADGNTFNSGRRYQRKFSVQGDASAAAIEKLIQVTGFTDLRINGMRCVVETLEGLGEATVTSWEGTFVLQASPVGFGLEETTRVAILVSNIPEVALLSQPEVAILAE